MNRWGNDEHGPGGDPSWLGGKDRGGPGAGSGPGSEGRSAAEAGRSPGSGPDGRSGSGAEGRSGPLPGGDGGWSSDFGSDSSRRRGDQDFDSSSRPVPEHSAPRFGSFGEDADGGDADRSRDRSDSGSDDGMRMPELKQILLGLLPIAIFIVVAIVFFRADFSFWWVAFFIILPTIQRVARTFGGNRKR